MGVGPGSYIWEGFVNPDNKLAQYSVALARISLYSDEEMDQATTVQSNITFGSANDDWYQGKPNIYMPSQSDFSYKVSYMGFGIVYQDDSGADSSEYFSQFDNGYSADFIVNFKGLGLPAALYGEFVSLFEYITDGDAVCSNTVDGICQLPAPCTNYTALNDFSFKVMFDGSTNGNYMRIPLATFSQGVKVSGGAQ